MGWMKPGYKDYLSPRENRVYDIISYSIYWLIIGAPILWVMFHGN